MQHQISNLQVTRQDWIRSNIRITGNGQYYENQADGYFETRKGLPKGYYTLRLSITTENKLGFCSVSIEPVGTNTISSKTYRYRLYTQRRSNA